MSPTSVTAPRLAWLQQLTKAIAVIASTGAAIASIVNALHTNGLIGKSATPTATVNATAAWVRIAPSIDTATAVGDTVAFAATAADRNGSVLGGIAPAWATGDSTVATVHPDGTVIARGPGVTTVTAVVGQHVARAHVIVRQRAAVVLLATTARDTTLAVLEGASATVRARALDARGHLIAGRPLQWSVADTLVATVDDAGVVTARTAGGDTVRATLDGASAAMPLAVIAVATQLALVEGAGQRALAGRRLAREVVVRATTRRGTPAVGKFVIFRVRAAQGGVEPATATTDADGRARTVWTLGDMPGSQALAATVEQVDSATTVEAEAEPVGENTRIVALAPALRAAVGAVLADSVAVRIADSLGHPLAGVPVRWSTAHGGVSGVDARTDSSGVARARWTLSRRAGPQRLHALVGVAESRIAPVEIVATALAGPPAGIVLVSGDRQRGTAGQPLAAPVVFRVVDAMGNPVANVPVGLAPTAGSLPDSAVRTDSLGVVRARWTVGRQAGDQVLAARVPGIAAPRRATSHGRAAAPARLVIDEGPAGPAGKGAGHRLVARVTDAFGNPVGGTALSFTTRSGTVIPARGISDATGRMALRWTPGTGGGERALRGTVRSTSVTAVYQAQETAPVSLAGSPRRAKRGTPR